MTRPRPNEHLGEHGKGIITRRYKQGQNFTASVELTFSHLGYFEFRLCNLTNENKTEPEDCFDQNLLSLSDGSGVQFPVMEFEAHWYNINLTLPRDVTCTHCVLQWQYVAGEPAFVIRTPINS